MVKLQIKMRLYDDLHYCVERQKHPEIINKI
ncbi:hypothetical protein M2265_000653 [Sphingobacterium kitahiroshimense]|nr:hypothetical protein [Sphingobacterium kitahiroshimense]